MSRITRSKRRSAAAAALLALLACLLLAACGGSSGSSSTLSANASATRSTSSTGQPAGRKRFTALRECLAKNGITLPKRTPGQAGGGGFLGGGAGGGGPQLPKGVTRAQYEAAVKKCGGFAGGRFAPGAAGTQRFKSPAFTQALTKFAACMRENGVKLPTPNTSGKGPIFNTSGLNPASAAFKAAQTKCSSALRGAFRAQPGRAGSPPSAG